MEQDIGKRSYAVVFRDGEISPLATCSIRRCISCSNFSEKTYSGQLAEAIEKLPELQRQIILLRYADGYTNRDIAAMLDFTVAKVDKIISRARKQQQISTATKP